VATPISLSPIGVVASPLKGVSGGSFDMTYATTASMICHE
jgi:hypothetical protein